MLSIKELSSIEEAHPKILGIMETQLRQWGWKRDQTRDIQRDEKDQSAGKH